MHVPVKVKRVDVSKTCRIADCPGAVLEFYKRAAGYCIVYYGLDLFDMSSPSASYWIVPGTVVY